MAGRSAHTEVNVAAVEALTLGLAAMTEAIMWKCPTCAGWQNKQKSLVKTIV